jgi:endonuclease/exonuclease/phosphatase (EEP) superfamily protein YafD
LSAKGKMKRGFSPLNAASCLLMLGASALLVQTLALPTFDFGFLAPALFWLAVMIGTVELGLLALRRDKVMLGLQFAAGAIFISGVHYVPEHLFAPRDAPKPGIHTFRVLTANLGTDPRAGARLVRLVGQYRPDIVFLQESYEPHRFVLTSALRRYRFAAGCMYPNQCNAALLTRLPVKSVIETDGNAFVAAELYLPMRGNQPVVIVAASVHLTRGQPATQKRQILALAQALEGRSGRRIIAGDLNLTPWSPMMKVLESSGDIKRWTRDFPTWPTPHVTGLRGFSFPFPIVAIDHILTSGELALSSGPQRLDFGSDHFAVLATFRVIANSGE